MGMKIAIIGPTHPYKGGIAQETTALAHELTEAGNEVTIISWRAQYPGRLYPGEQFVPDDKPELPLFTNSHRVLSWKSPLGWQKWGRKLRAFDRVIFVWWVPTIQGPIYLTMLRALGKKQRPLITIICHNVLPHESRPGDKQLAGWLLKRADRIIVHTAEQAAVAQTLTTREIVTVDLPLALPGKPPARSSQPPSLKRQLLFFGIVRPYKGLDVLLKAIAKVPDVSLTVAGEFWDEALYDQLLIDLKLGDRVELRKGYVPADDLPELFAKADATVLPYRSGTGSFQIKIAQMYGLPVIATTAGPLKKQIRDGIDGLQCAPDDVDSLARAIRRFYEPGVAATLRQGVPQIPVDFGWKAYVQAITRP